MSIGKSKVPYNILKYLVISQSLKYHQNPIIYSSILEESEVSLNI